jgi:hypothetical protein
LKILKTLALVLTIISASSCKEIKKENNMKILFVLTSHDKLGDTGKKPCLFKCFIKIFMKFTNLLEQINFIKILQEIFK